MSEQKIPFESLMIGATVNILAQHINRRVAQSVREHGFTDFRASFHPVFQWCRPEGSRLTELAEWAGVTKPAMSEIVDILVRLGYVERTPDPSDRRATLIRRTERGWEINRVARQVVEAVQAEWSQAIGAEAFSQVLDGLRRLTRLATERGPDEESNWALK
jgi:DNA-binding MarR family transcriptional regulator